MSVSASATTETGDDWFRRTEGALYRLPQMRIQVRALATALAYFYPSFTRPDNILSVGREGQQGDVTLAYVQRRAAVEERLQRLEASIAVLDAALSTLTPDEARLVDLKYTSQLVRDTICREMGISRATYHRLREAAVVKVARCLGYID
ncbi:MAG: DUF1492 domain-containing protein [Bacillota bacterium]|nr:DUF1492 domain-containing protein [Bacillota bacterium]